MKKKVKKSKGNIKNQSETPKIKVKHQKSK
jgi:hypothetical protein